MLSTRTVPSWQVWECPPAPGIVNMATDAALLASVGPDMAVWRWYSWARPTVSFGRNEQIKGRYSAESLARSGFDAVRRPTGGRALLHDQELTYSVVLPVARQIGWREPYRAISTLLLEALREVGVPVESAPPRLGQRPDGPVCFDAPDAGELLLHGRKLVGSAVWRQDNVYLQHGSILLADRQGDLADAADAPLPPVPPAAALNRVAGAEQLPALVARLKLAISHRLAAWNESTALPLAFAPNDTLLQQIERETSQFSRDTWLWRR
ncbi:MAG: lipoate--protein ligase family protein [Gemmatimonadaceae bacterium]|nr:lipoate--protein ligase family protein [Gemmatimonadaceae bacterium]